MKSYDYILFDLDGTLIESAESVRISIAYAMRALDLPCPDLSDYSEYVGPPLEDTMRGLCAVPEALVPQAIQIYRDYYDEVGKKTIRVFDGMTETLSKLQKQGKKLAVCTSKIERVAGQVSDDLGLRPYFDAVCGSDADAGRLAKADVIPYALDALGCSDKSKALMIGDTVFDARGARLAGVDFLGVTYGYGVKESMEACGAVGFADSPRAIADFLL